MFTCPQLKLCNFFLDERLKMFKIKLKSNLQVAAIYKKDVNIIQYQYYCLHKKKHTVLLQVKFVYIFYSYGMSTYIFIDFNIWGFHWSFILVTFAIYVSSSHWYPGLVKSASVFFYCITLNRKKRTDSFHLNLLLDTTIYRQQNYGQFKV